MSESVFSSGAKTAPFGVVYVGPTDELETCPLPAISTLRRVGHVMTRTISRAWDHSIFAKSATAAFYQTLSLPPLMLGLLGSIGYVAGWFGPNTLELLQSRIISFSRNVFSTNVVDQLIAPTVTDVIQNGRADIMSISFLLSFWAGSSACSTFVDAITAAHDQAEARHPVVQRLYAIWLYVLGLIVGVFVLPIVAVGPEVVKGWLPPRWFNVGSQFIQTLYYPVVGLLLIVALTTLYKLALHKSLPWHRLLGGALVAGLVFLVASKALRVYLSWALKEGSSYGALATPIAFLLFTFMLGFAIVIGAEFNATIQEFWPAKETRVAQSLERLAGQVTSGSVAIVGLLAQTTVQTVRIATGPLRVAAEKARAANADDETSPEDADDSGAPDEEAPESAKGSGDQRPEGSDSYIRLQSSQTGEPGLGARVTGKTSPHSATT